MHKEFVDRSQFQTDPTDQDVQERSARRIMIYQEISEHKEEGTIYYYGVVNKGEVEFPNDVSEKLPSPNCIDKRYQNHVVSNVLETYWVIYRPQVNLKRIHDNFILCG